MEWIRRSAVYLGRRSARFHGRRRNAQLIVTHAALRMHTKMITIMGLRLREIFPATRALDHATYKKAFRASVWRKEGMKKGAFVVMRATDSKSTLPLHQKFPSTHPRFAGGLYLASLRASCESLNEIDWTFGNRLHFWLHRSKHRR